MPQEIEGTGVLVIEEGRRDNNSVYIEFIGSMKLSLDLSAEAAQFGRNHFGSIVLPPQARLTVELSRPSPAVMRDLETLCRLHRRFRLQFDLSPPSSVFTQNHQLESCEITHLQRSGINDVWFEARVLMVGASEAFGASGTQTSRACSVIESALPINGVRSWGHAKKPKPEPDTPMSPMEARFARIGREIADEGFTEED